MVHCVEFKRENKTKCDPAVKPHYYVF